MLTFLKLALTVILLSWFLLRSDIKSIIGSLSLLSLKVVILWATIDTIAMFVNTYKWFLLLKKYPYFKLLKLNLISQYYSLILPGQLAGEIVKGYLLENGKKNTSKIVSSIAIDKLTGFVGLFIVSLVGVIFSDTMLAGNFKWFFSFGIAISLFLLFSFKIEAFYSCIIRFLNLILKGSLAHVGFKFLTTWHIYSEDTRTMLLSIFMGTLYQLLSVLSVTILTNGLNINISIIDWLWIMGILSLALFIPLTIAGIGIRDGTLIGILVWMGRTREEALALSFAMLGFKIIYAMVGGLLIFTLRRHLTSISNPM